MNDHDLAGSEPAVWHSVITTSDDEHTCFRGYDVADLMRLQVGRRLPWEEVGRSKLSLTSG